MIISCRVITSGMHQSRCNLNRPLRRHTTGNNKLFQSPDIYTGFNTSQNGARSFKCYILKEYSTRQNFIFIIPPSLYYFVFLV